MTVDINPYVFWLVTGVLGLLIAWLLRVELRGQRHSDELRDLKLHNSETFATKDAMQRLSEKLDEALGLLNRLVGRQEAGHGG